MPVTSEQVESILAKIRPSLQIDNGDVELVEISQGNIVKIRLLGACHTCPLNLMTLRAGIERVLIREIPEVVRIESVMN